MATTNPGDQRFRDSDIGDWKKLMRDLRELDLLMQEILKRLIAGGH